MRRPASVFASLDVRPGWLTLTGTDATLDAQEPVFVGRRQQHHHAHARTLVDAAPDAEAGLAVRMDETAHYEVAVAGERIIAKARIGPLHAVVAHAERPPGPVTLAIETAPSDVGGPDSVRLGFESHDGTFAVLADLDGRYLSTEVTGGFIGRVIGIYAVGGEAAFDWFDYRPVAIE
jgi:beta-xylosidase